MRSKDEILVTSTRAISKALKEGQDVPERDYYLLEAILDIRDILNLRLPEINRTLRDIYKRQ